MGSFPVGIKKDANRKTKFDNKILSLKATNF